MIRLYSFGPAFGQIDPSPFVVKAHTLLRMAGLEYKTAPADFKKAPKGKFPVVEDDGLIVPDTTLIRFHIEKKYEFDFDKGLSLAERGAAWAFEKLCEDHLYWATVHERWMIDENFKRGPLRFFDKAPALLRGFIANSIRKKVKRNLFGQGFGRYTAEERRAIAGRAIGAIADYLADRAFIGGDKPCGADASVFATLAGYTGDYFETFYLCDEAAKHPALGDYVTRMKALYFPEGK